jgi:hypothetical protein
MDGKWQSEIEEKQSTICLQMVGEPARYVAGQELNYYILIKQKKI